MLAALEVLALSGGRVPLESRTPKRSWGAGVVIAAGCKPVKAKVRLRVSESPTPRVTGEPAFVKNAEIISALVVAQVNRAEPGATATTVLLCALSQEAEFGGASVVRSPSANVSFMMTTPSGLVTLSVAGALGVVPAELLTLTT